MTFIVCNNELYILLLSLCATTKYVAMVICIARKWYDSMMLMLQQQMTTTTCYMRTSHAVYSQSIVNTNNLISPW